MSLKWLSIVWIQIFLFSESLVTKIKQLDKFLNIFIFISYTHSRFPRHFYNFLSTPGMHLVSCVYWF